MTKLFFEMNAVDLEARIATEGRVPLEPLVQVHELQRGGLVLEDENLKVTAALVDHPPMVPAFAYRFDAPDRSIVISGDTKRSDNLVELARGADVLFTRSIAGPRPLGGEGGSALPQREHPLFSGNGRGRSARRADGGCCDSVLSHLIPLTTEVTEEMWLDARAITRGSIVVGRDLMEI
jgi:ribonuclease BN (tRNA processing enzyme)